MTSICVYCGSHPGTDPRFTAAAHDLGRQIARRGLRLVYGGASVGLMGTVADAVLAGGGDVVGVIPGGLFEEEVAHRGLPDLRVVASMHERKQVMADEADAFVALPGGYGTFEELLETITWRQLGLHDKLVGVLDVAGFYAPLRQLVDRAAAEGFIRPGSAGWIVHDEDPGSLLDRLVG